MAGDASEAGRLSKTQLTALALATLAGALARFYLAGHPIGGVEVERIAATLSGDFAWDPFRPPLLYILMYAWSPLAATPFLWRLPVVLISLAAVPAVYFFARALLRDRDVAFWAALLTAASAFQIEFAHWMNDYPLLGLLFLGNTACFWRYFEEGKSRWFLAGFLVTHIVSLQTHYMALDVLIIQGAYLLWRRGWRGLWPLAKWSLIVLAAAPWWLTLWGPMKQRTLESWTMNTGVVIPYTYFSYFVGQNYLAWGELRAHAFSVNLWLPAGLMAFLAWRLFRTGAGPFVRMMAFMLAASVLFFWALSFRFPVFGVGLPKYSFPFALLFNVLIAISVSRLPSLAQRWGAAAAYVFFQGVSCLNMVNIVY